MTDSDRDKEIERLVSEEVQDLEAAGQLYRFTPERRCRVCSDDTARVLVDRLLANGVAYRAIVDILDQSINTTREPGDKITKNSVYNHRRQHFDVDRPASAVYRRLLEERADEHDQNYVDGTTHVINYASYLETVVLKAYEKLVSDESNVSIEHGMSAVVKLAELRRRDADVGQLAAKIGELNTIITAVRAEVSPQQYARISARLRGETPADESPLDVETDDGVEEFDIGGIALQDKGDGLDE
jgi:hypothetical protein